MTTSRSDAKYDGQKLLSGGRLVELILVSLTASLISGALVAWASLQVLQTEVTHLRASQDEMKRELQQFRQDFYSPRRWERDMQFDAVDLISELRASLHEAAQYFHGVEDDPDADFQRHLVAAAAELGEHRGLTLVGEVELTPGTNRYPGLPADLVYIKTPLWGQSERIKPWADDYPGPLPRPRLAWEDGSRVLYLTPAPTHAQIRTLGATYQFFYGASYWDGDPSSQIEIDQEGRSLLLLRAQAEACRELALQNMTRPVETRTSLSQPRNQTPGGLFEALMKEFRQRVGVAA